MIEPLFCVVMGNGSPFRRIRPPSLNFSEDMKLVHGCLRRSRRPQDARRGKASPPWPTQSLAWDRSGCVLGGYPGLLHTLPRCPSFSPSLHSPSSRRQPATPLAGSVWRRGERSSALLHPKLSANCWPVRIPILICTFFRTWNRDRAHFTWLLPDIESCTRLPPGLLHMRFGEEVPRLGGKAVSKPQDADREHKSSLRKDFRH